jgi:hypothetical protein
MALRYGFFLQKEKDNPDFGKVAGYPLFTGVLPPDINVLTARIPVYE